MNEVVIVFIIVVVVRPEILPRKCNQSNILVEIRIVSPKQENIFTVLVSQQKSKIWLAAVAHVLMNVADNLLN